MKQTLGIVRYNFFGFFRNPKVIFTLFLEFVLSFLLTGRIMVVMDKFYIRFLIIRMNTILSNILKYRKTLILPRIYHD